MEHGVIRSDLNENEIKPKDLLHAYVKQTTEDNIALFPASDLASISCPACNSQKKGQESLNCGMKYQDCAECRTLYVSPRPSPAKVELFFRESKARHYWFNQIWKRTSEHRKAKIIGPHLDWIQTFVEEYFPERKASVAELQPSHWGLLELALERKAFSFFKVVDPLFPAALCPVDSMKANTLPYSISEKFDAICLMDALGRSHNPFRTLQWANEHLNSGGLCLITTLLSSGFDLMTLGARSESLIPPDHLNLFSFEGLQSLLSSSGFEIIELSTPGVLDLQNVQEALSTGNLEIPAFFRYILETRKDPALNQAFQDFLQTHRLSSQARVVLRKH